MVDPEQTSRLSITRAVAGEGHIGDPMQGVVMGRSGEIVAGVAPESLLVVAWRSRWIILACVVLALVGGFMYIQTVTPIYTSMCKLYLDYVSLPREIASDSGQRPQTERYLHTQMGLLKSRPVISAALEKIDQRLRTFDKVDMPVEFIRKNIDVQVGRKDEIISVSFDSPYPVEAAQIVNHIVGAYMDSRTEHEQRNSAQVLKILQEDMKRVNGEIDRKRNELKDFQTDQMPMALGSNEGGGVMQAYLEVQGAFQRARLASSEAESFLKGVGALTGRPDALRQYLQVRGGANSYYVATNAEKAPLEARLTELALQIKEQSERFTPDYPGVIALAKQKTELESKLAEVDSRFVRETADAAEQYYATATENERHIAEFYGEQQKRVIALNGEMAQYEMLRSELDRLVGYAQTLEQQVREVGRIVGEDVGQLRIATLELAEPAHTPSSPQKAKAMAMALLFGLFLGGAIGVARDWLDQKLRSVDEISAMLGLPVLGSIPTMSRRQKIQMRGRKVFLQPDSHEAEAFRTIRTAIFFGAPKDNVRTFLVTSPAAGDGKSTLVSNLAIAMASAGQKTLVLDADLRRPTQHVIFEADHVDRCLDSVLKGKIGLRMAVKDTEVRGLSLLSCGQGFSNPAEILNSPRFAKLLEHLGRAYDRILIDAPPVTVVTDAQILGALCDRTILVVKADNTTRRTAQRAINALRSVNAQLLGVVVNSVGGSDGYYGYYRRYRPYGSGSNGEGSRGRRVEGTSKGPRSAVRVMAQNTRYED